MHLFRFVCAFWDRVLFLVTVIWFVQGHLCSKCVKVNQKLVTHILYLQRLSYD